MTTIPTFRSDIRKISTLVLVFVIFYGILAYLELRYQSLTWLADQIVPLVVKL